MWLPQRPNAKRFQNTGIKPNSTSMTDTTLLPYVIKPGRYLGKEHNSIKKNWRKNTVSCALVFPDLYEIGMSHQGLQILYHIINSSANGLAERAYCPDFDMVRQLKAKGLQITSLESGYPLTDFDLIGITLPYELCYTNILTVLDLCSIEPYARDRAQDDPLIIGGGSCSMNPEPVADFFDAILLGDGEEGIIDMIRLMKRAKKHHFSKEETLYHLREIEGMYIPSFFAVDYTFDGKIDRIKPLADDYSMVHRRVLANLNDIDHLTKPLVPNGSIVHDRLGIEIGRGCTRGCRFCQAGMIYRPVRERTVDEIEKLARLGISSSGFDELALLSLSTGDYSCLDELLRTLMDSFSSEHVSVSMPSMRVGTLTQSVMDQIRRVRKTGFTIAPEAGSERLRQVINKGISEDDLITTCRDAFSLGWKLIKLYFMIGLPTETQEDVESIVTLVKRAKDAGIAAGVGRKQINVSVGTFVPKPHTPFQWEAQITMEQSRDHINRLKKLLPRKGFNLKWHDPKQSYLEGVFSRGDRRLSALLVTAWKNGAGLDSWSDHFNLDVWLQAAQQCNIDLDSYLRRRELTEVLPWQHLHCGVDTGFLKDELKKAHKLEYTPDCRYHNCHKCGLCDFKRIKPVVVDRKRATTGNSLDGTNSYQDNSVARPDQHPENHFKYCVTYEKKEPFSYLGHLELVQLIFRAIRRAGITVNFSRGYNPSPRISFSQPIPVGTQSLVEFFIMDLPQTLTDPEKIKNDLNDQLPEGLQVRHISPHSGKFPQAGISSYTITFPSPLTPEEQREVVSFLGKSDVFIQRTRKRRQQTINVRPLITNMELLGDDRLNLSILSKAGEPSVKVIEAIEVLFPARRQELLDLTILKTDWRSWENP